MLFLNMGYVLGMRTTHELIHFWANGLFIILNLNSGPFNNQIRLDGNSNIHLLQNRSLFF